MAGPSRSTNASKFYIEWMIECDVMMGKVL